MAGFDRPYIAGFQVITEGEMTRFPERALQILGEFGDNSTNLDLLDSCVGQLVPFVGAGLSFEFGYPGWHQFLRGAANRLGLLFEVDPLLENKQWEEAAEVLTHDRPNAFEDILRSTFDDKNLLRPINTGAVRHLPLIFQGVVLTTNFDCVLEAAFEDASRPFERSFPGSRIREATGAIQLNKRYLLKLHGDLRDSASRVLTLTEYAREYGSPKVGGADLKLPLPRVIGQVLGARPLLFVGCSLKGDRTTRVIAQLATNLPGTIHFALLSGVENTRERCRQLDSWNIRPLFFPEGEYDHIQRFLGCLADAVSAGSPKGHLADAVSQLNETTQRVPIDQPIVASVLVAAGRNRKWGGYQVDGELGPESCFTAAPALLDKNRGTQYVEVEISKLIDRLPKRKRILKAIIFVDVDDLTVINKHFGKGVGDIVLRVVVNLIHSQKPVAACGRCGDDTFFAYLPKADDTKAARVSEHVRGGVEGFPWRKVCADLRVKCSCGYAEIDPNEHPHDWIVRAIEGLLDGKRQGGNVVTPGPLYAGPYYQGKRIHSTPSSHQPLTPTEQVREVRRQQQEERRLELSRFFS